MHSSSFARLFSDSEEFGRILQELDGSELAKTNNDLKIGEAKISVFEKLKKTQTAINELTNQVFLERYGIPNIQMSNVE